jgi:predicted transcriptional regulator YheO
MKTITEIAKEIDISRQKIYRYIKKENIKSILSDVSMINHDKRVMRFDDESVTLIIKHFISDSTSSDESNNDQVINHDELNDTRLINALNEQITYLKEQIKFKDELLRNEQILRLQRETKKPILKRLFGSKKSEL